MEPFLLDPTAAAKYTGFSERILAGMADKGQIRCTLTPDGQRRYHAEDLQEINDALSFGYKKRYQPHSAS